MSDRRRRGGLVGLGLGLFVLGLVVFVVAAVVGYGASERTVKGFARAPVGCTTTVEFRHAGRFTLYVETKGRVAALDGDCAGNGAAYSRRDDDPPRLDVAVVADDGSTLPLDDPAGDDYDVEGYAGTGVASVRITEPGTYRVTVRGEADDVAVAIGDDPNADAMWWWLGGFAVAAVVGLLGVVLFVVGLVGRRTPPAAPVSVPTMAPGPWSTLPPPPPPPPGPRPDATGAGTTLPPPPPPVH